MTNEPRLTGAPADNMPIGARVEVRNVDLQTWSRGFRVAGIVNDAYLIRRVRDDCVLPRSFRPEDIRPC